MADSMGAVTTVTTPVDELTEAPSWLPDGCPPWCDLADMHRQGDHPDDRIHGTWNRHVDASTDEPESSVNACLVQGYREIAPRIWVGADGTGQGHHLTVDEAREYALQILELTKIADGI